MNLDNPIATGNTAKIYLSDGKIIKVFNDNFPDNEAKYESDKQKFAYSCGLPVPQIYEIMKINGKQAIIMEHCKGRTIGDLVYEDMSKVEQYINISVDIQLKIHSMEAKDLELMSEKLSRQIQSTHSLSDKQKDFLLKRMGLFQYDKKLCHGDFHMFNLIMNEDKVTIIDWVDASAGDVRADVYRTYLLYSQVSKDLANLYIQRYCDKSGIPKDEIFIWEPIIAGARLAENVENEESLINIVCHYCPV